MSDGRTTVTLRDEAYDALDAANTEDESFSDTVLRLAKLPNGDGELTVNTPDDSRMLTEEHIDDIAAETNRQVEQTLRTLLQHGP